MFKTFSNYLKDKAHFTNAEIEQIKGVCMEKTILKGELLMLEGTVCDCNTFVCSGLLRSFYTDINGAEFVLSFAPDDYWVGDRQSILTGTPTPYSVDALVDTDVIVITQKDFNCLCTKIDTFNTMMSRLIKKHLTVTEERVTDGMRLSAEQKYHNFLAKHAAVAATIPHHMIASYVGITPEVLTRIQKNKF